MELGLVQRLIVAARCSEEQNKSMRWDESGWSGRTTQGFFFFILQQDLEVRFYIPVNSRMLTNISLEGHNVHSCSAAPSAGPGWLSHLVIVAQLGQCRCNHPPSFLWAVWEAWDWMCNPFTLPDNLCWAAGLTDSFSWLFHKLTISFPKRTQNVFFFFLNCVALEPSQSLYPHHWWLLIRNLTVFVFCDCHPHGCRNIGIKVFDQK